MRSLPKLSNMTLSYQGQPKSFFGLLLPRYPLLWIARILAIYALTAVLGTTATYIAVRLQNHSPPPAIPQQSEPTPHSPGLPTETFPPTAPVKSSTPSDVIADQFTPVPLAALDQHPGATSIDVSLSASSSDLQVWSTVTCMPNAKTIVCTLTLIRRAGGTQNYLPTLITSSSTQLIDQSNRRYPLAREYFLNDVRHPVASVTHSQDQSTLMVLEFDGSSSGDSGVAAIDLNGSSGASGVVTINLSGSMLIATFH